MSIFGRASTLALAGLIALCMSFAIPATDAHARGASSHSDGAKTYRSGKKKYYRTAKRKRSAKRYATAHKGKRRVHKARHASHHRSQRRHRSASYRRGERMGLGASAATASRTIRRPERSSGNISWSASASCLDSTLRHVVHQVAARFGSLRVNSTCRSHEHNRRVGGAGRSKHLSGDAVDFRVFGNVGAVASFLRSHGSVGGYKHYGGGLFHIDNGDRRSW